MPPPLSPTRREVTFRLKIVTSFDLRLQVNANHSPVPLSSPSISAISDDALMEFLKAGFLSISRRELSKACAREGLARTYPLLCAYSTTTLALSRGPLLK